MANIKIDNNMHKDILNKSTHISAWVQVGVPLAVGLFGVWFFWFRRR
jgi:hypothetical protein